MKFSKKIIGIWTLGMLALGLIPVSSTVACSDCNYMITQIWLDHRTGTQEASFESWYAKSSKRTFSELEQEIENGKRNGGITADIPLPIAEAVFKLGISAFANFDKNWQSKHTISEVLGTDSRGGINWKTVATLIESVASPLALEAYKLCLEKCDPLQTRFETASDSEFHVTIDWQPKSGDKPQLTITQISSANCTILEPSDAKDVSVRKPLILSNDRPNLVLLYRRTDPASVSVVTLATSRQTRSISIPSKVSPVQVLASDSTGANSGLSVKQGERIGVQSHGEWYPGGGLPWVGQNGIAGGVLTKQQQDNLRCPQASLASLIAEVGNKYVPVVSGRFVAPASGQVRFLCNDGKGSSDYADNKGSLTVSSWKDTLSKP
ncbi:MAG: LecA/PA-IL family lectin [Candidatus Obscuribacterales bacterium]|nr:LecA/PA-IL family lectin [Candidatus Obscuribacterales bacterium]